MSLHSDLAFKYLQCKCKACNYLDPKIPIHWQSICLFLFFQVVLFLVNEQAGHHRYSVKDLLISKLQNHCPRSLDWTFSLCPKWVLKHFCPKNAKNGNEGLQNGNKPVFCESINAKNMDRNSRKIVIHQYLSYFWSKYK